MTSRFSTFSFFWVIKCAFVYNQYILFASRIFKFRFILFFFITLFFLNILVSSCITERKYISHIKSRDKHSLQRLFHVKRIFSPAIDRNATRLSLLLSRIDLVASKRSRFRGHFRTFESFSIISRQLFLFLSLHQSVSIIDLEAF